MKKFTVATIICCLCSGAWAFDPDFTAIEDSTIIARYPTGSIVARDKADLALSEVRRAKSRLNELSEYSSRRCQENFFVNSCIEDVRKARMRQERRLMAIESEARAVIRADKAREEKMKQAQRDRKAAMGPAQSFKARREEQSVSTPANVNAHDQRMQQLQERQREYDQRAAREAENRAKYEQRQAEHEQRVQERRVALEKRRAKKEKQQQEH